MGRPLTNIKLLSGTRSTIYAGAHYIQKDLPEPPLRIFSTNNFLALALFRLLAITVVGLALITGSTPAQARVAGYVTKEIGGATYNIPVGYFDGPTSSSSSDILLSAYLPNLQQGRRPSHGWGKRVAILAMDASKTKSVEYRFSRTPEIYGALSLTGKRFGLSAYRSAREWFTPRQHPPGTSLEKTLQEIFVASPPGTLFIDCTGDKAVPFPSCAQHFSYDNLTFVVSYGKSHLRDWAAIRDATIELFKSFKFLGSDFQTPHG